MRSTKLLLIAAALLVLIGCDTWGHKEAYQSIPTESRGVSISANAAEVKRVAAQISDALTIVANKYNLKRLTDRNGLPIYSVPDFEGKDIVRGTISVNSDERDGNTRVNLMLNQFGTVWPYGEKIFDETIDLLNQKYGLALSINREPRKVPN